MILAGDIGGTHTRLAFFDVVDAQFRLISASVFPSREYSGLDEIVTKFVQTSGEHPDAACFGIAGPITNGRVETSNLPWIIESKRLSEELRVRKALLINDVEASAWGIAALEPTDFKVLSKAADSPVGNQAVIAAGTGLGESAIYWDGMQHRIFASEGGHSDFAPRNDLEIELLRYLLARHHRVSFERVLSGPGLLNIYWFLRDSGRGTEPRWLTEQMAHSDAAAAISAAGLGGKCPLCEQALDMFVSIYGAEAGNLALKIKSTGGVFVAGGIAPKLLSKLCEPAFMTAFLDKGRMRPLLESIPVKLITNEKLALVGAARCAVMRTPT